MKNILFFFVFLCLFTSALNAQKVTVHNNQKTDLIASKEKDVLTNFEITKQQKKVSMKWSTEIFTTKVIESKTFYCQNFDFIVKFETEGFVILQHQTNPAYELMFCIPNSPFNDELFHPEFQRAGVLFQMEVENVEKEYEKMKKLGIPIRLDLVDEPVNGKHFTVMDPNNIPIDIVEFPK